MAFRAWLGFESIATRRVQLATFTCSVVVLLFVATLIYSGPLFGLKLSSLRINGRYSESLSQSNPDFYDWHTRSQIRPVSQKVGNKSTQDLCNAFPKDLLRNNQHVLKTGHGVLETRVKNRLEGVSAYLDSILRIFSDLDSEVADYQVIDVLSASVPISCTVTTSLRVLCSRKS